MTLYLKYSLKEQPQREMELYEQQGKVGCLTEHMAVMVDTGL